MGGRHRAPRKLQLRWVSPTLIVLLIPTLVVFGYFRLASQEAIQLHTTNAYADAPLATVAMRPVPAPSLTLAPTLVAAPDSQPSQAPTTAQRPTEKDAGSSLTTSTTPPTQPHQAQDQKPSPSSSAPRPAKIKADHKCANLDSDPKVVQACNAIMAQFPNVSSMGGRAARPDNPTSCHPDGLGLDVMVSSNQLGDAVNKWVHDHRQELQIAWIGWEVPDHWDHVHLSFQPCKG